VPAADSQLIANLAASGLALTGATGGIRCTRLLSEGMSHTGSESVPAKGDPRRVVLNLTLEKTPFKPRLESRRSPERAARHEIIQGSQA
jgi:hypothetical protein